ncbi:hypothetical protein, partial [Thermocatellispora tengchongensis]|uniref:hypothetical protein n=1 Tax=Thermocatellispora tengchongensis TaxID=1073253 RepID=UPI003CD05769
EQYRTDRPAWEVLLDVDALAAAEGVEWVFAGTRMLRPPAGEPYRRALVMLSPDGGDAVEVREFGLDSRDWVAPDDRGFRLPAANTPVSWDGPDALYIATAVCSSWWRSQNTSAGRAMTPASTSRRPSSSSIRRSSGHANPTSASASSRIGAAFCAHRSNRMNAARRRGPRRAIIRLVSSSLRAADRRWRSCGSWP